MQNKIRSAFNDARKNKDELKRKTYESVIAKITVAEKSGKYSLPLKDDNIVDIIQKEIKELEETRACYLEIPPLTSIENKIVDKVSELDAQIKELKQYLPEMMPEEDVRCIISEIVASGETNKGKIIGATVKVVGNRFDKSLISKMVATVLGA